MQDERRLGVVLKVFRPLRHLARMEAAREALARRVVQLVDEGESAATSLLAADVAEGVAVKVVGRGADEPGELVALADEAVVLNVDITFLIGVDLSNEHC